MRKIRSQTKTVVTLGPSSGTKEIISKLIIEGVDVFRLNFSHSNHSEHLRLINLIKELNSELKTNVSILADLQGPKIRIGDLENNGLMLKEGDIIYFVTEKANVNSKNIYINYEDFSKDVKQGEKILLDDGKIMLEVLESNNKDKVILKVIYGGLLSSRKGVNLPDTKVSLPSLTKEDKENAEFALENDVDWLALSFVRKAEDLNELKKIIEREKCHTRIIAKIEKPEAIKDIDNIINNADGIMVARGDLGVEVSFDQVPLLQKIIVRKCIEQSKPVIIATQMMESMINNFRPTRAEATDVANAVLDGADALMLSGETSVGKYPVESIACVQKIIDFTEANGKPFNKQHPPFENSENFLTDSICYNTTRVSQQINAKAIIVFSHTGYSAIRISSHKPQAAIFAFTDNVKLLRQMSLVWGVRAFYIDTHNNLDEAFNSALNILKELKLVIKDDTVIYVGSTPLSQHGNTNMLKLDKIK